jgi:hypothetical protein
MVDQKLGPVSSPIRPTGAEFKEMSLHARHMMGQQLTFPQNYQAAPEPG